MNILFIEPFYTGSHASWIEGIISHSSHSGTSLTLPGRNWKWRMHGGSITLAGEFLKLKERPDLIIASDMLDLTGFLALTREITHSIPTAIYFHENQLTYPWSPVEKNGINVHKMHYSFINFISALAADFVLFNSQFHMEDFTGKLPDFLKQFPDYNEVSSVESIISKSNVLPVGIDLERFDHLEFYNSAKSDSDVPTILWNHRWEYDKNPALFFDSLCALDSKGVDFKLIVLGESFATIPKEFKKAKSNLSSKIIKFGYAESAEEYAEWLNISDIIPITSIQDFFGISIIEALYCGCIPCLPKRLSYPEIVPINSFNEFFYDEGEDIVTKLEYLITNYKSIDRTQFREITRKYDWKKIIGVYDTCFEEMVDSHKTS